MALTAQIKSHAEELSKKIISKSSTDAQLNSTQCIEILKSLENIFTADSFKESKNEMITTLKETKIGNCLNKSLRAFRRYKRSTNNRNTEQSSNSDKNNNNDWELCITMNQRLLTHLKEKVKKEAIGSTTNATSTAMKKTDDRELPSSSSDYRSRLITQKKEMYKDPPVLPPQPIIIESTFCCLPKRNSSNSELSFVLSTAQMNIPSKLLQYIKDFKPNRSPEEVLRAGSFGGTYFRPIISSVTNVRYNSMEVLKETVESDWISNLDRKTTLTSSTYNNYVNKYKVKCGGSLGMWESSGWISDSDPYGWFQWYCNFYKGRRCSDDERQISRWLKIAGPKGRFRSQLCNKIFAQGGLGKVNDFKISPVIRQTLLHWGLEITEDILKKHGKRVGRL